MKTKLISLAILMIATFNVIAQDAAADMNAPSKQEQRSAQWPMPL